MVPSGTKALVRGSPAQGFGPRRLALATAMWSGPRVVFEHPVDSYSGTSATTSYASCIAPNASREI